MANEDIVTLADGSGGLEMQQLVQNIIARFLKEHKWSNTDSDSAAIAFGDKFVVFTTDSFVVNPLFFRGGDIGKIAVCGTINDLAMSGAKPIGLSLALVIEEGFSKSLLFKIIDSAANESYKAMTPIVTGDTKVMEKGKIDKIVINTAGIGVADFILDKKVNPGDKVIVSGAIAEHGACLLCERFDIQANITTDSKHLILEIEAVKNQIKQAKDPTRGGIAAILNELAKKNACQIIVNEDMIPIRKEVRSVCEFLGITPYELACEGRLICIADSSIAQLVVDKLKAFNSDATIIGEVTEGSGVIIKTRIGRRILHTPNGVIVPRIC